MASKKEHVGYWAVAIITSVVVFGTMYYGSRPYANYTVIHHHIGGPSDRYEAQNLWMSNNAVTFSSNGKRYSLSGDITVIRE